MTRSVNEETSPRMLSKRPVRAVWYMGVALAVVTAITGFYKLNREPDTSAPAGGLHTPTGSREAAPVRAIIARKGTLTQHLTTSGTLRALRDVDVQARVGGTVTGVAVTNGCRVSRGDTLVRMDGREYRAAYERARAGLLNAQIEFRSLSSTPFLPSTDPIELTRRVEAESSALDSLRVLNASGRIDDAAYERLSREREAALAYVTASRGDVIAARSGLAAAREAFLTARLDMEWTSIVAPFDGVVADCSLSPGMHITAGQSLLRVLDQTTLLVDVEVLEHEVGRVAVGQAARVRLAGPGGREFGGLVLHLNPVVDPKAKTMKVTIALRGGQQPAGVPQSGLRPGMFATVLIETDVLTHRLIIPRAALLVRNERPLVFTAEHGRAKWRYVEPGEENEELLEIRSGIVPGDTVIVDGHHSLAHDAPVSVTRGSR